MHTFTFDSVILRMKQLGFIVTLAAAVVTFSFGWKLGEDIPNKIGLAVLLSACTFVVGYGLVATYMAWRQKLYVIAACSGILVAVAAIGELVAHAGASAANRDGTIAHARMQNTTWDDSRSRLKALTADQTRLQTKLGSEIKFQKGEAEAIIKTAHAHKWWKATAECTETKGPQTRAWCQQYREAEGAVTGWSARVGDSTELTRVQDEIAALMKSRPELASAAADSQMLILARAASGSLKPTEEQSFWASIGLSAMFALIAVSMGALLNLVSFAFDPVSAPHPRSNSGPSLKDGPKYVPQNRDRTAYADASPSGSTTLNMFGLGNTDEILKKWANDTRVGNLLKAA